MAELETRTAQQLPPLVAVAPNDLIIVQPEGGGPLSSARAQLFGSGGGSGFADAQVAAMLDVGKLAITEKRALIDWQTQTQSRHDALVSRGDAIGVATANTVTLRAAWLTYRAGLNPSWNDVSQPTAIVRASFDLARASWIAALDALGKAISEYDARNAEVAQSVTGQTAWATYSGLVPANVAGQVQYLSTSGNIDSIQRATDRRLNLLRRADGVTDVTEAALITSLGTAAAIAGQQAWATFSGLTPSDVAGQVQYLNTSGNLTSLDRITDRRVTRLRRDDGVTDITEAALITSLGTAAAIAGQQPWATYSGLVPGNVAGQVQYLNTSGNLASLDRITDRRVTRLKRDDGTTDVTEAALITSLGTAAAIAGQQPWATYSGLVPSNVAGQVQYLSTSGNLDSIQRATDRRLNLLRRADGVTDVTEAALVTSFGTAAAIAGQQAWATFSGLTPSDVAGQVQYLNTSGNLSSLDRITDRRVTRLRRDDGVTDITEAALITSLGTAAAIAGQQPWATYADYTPSAIAPRVAFGLDSSGDLARNIPTSRLNGSNILRYSGGALYAGHLNADVTGSNISAGFVGQGALAGLNTVTWGSHVTGRDVWLTDGRIPNGLSDSGRNIIGLRGTGGNVDNTEIFGGLMGTNIAENPEFHNGFDTGWYIYDNAESGKVSKQLIADSSAPNSSGIIMRVSYNGTGVPNTFPGGPTPGFGGVCQALQDAVGATGSAVSRPGFYARNTFVVWRLWAKIPVGYSIEPASNLIGDGAQFQWLTSAAGTGDWALYVMRTKIGATGSFGVTGFWYIYGGPNVAFSWEIAKFDQIDITSSPRMFLGRGGVSRQNGGTIFDSDAITGIGISAGFAGQGPWAGFSSFSPTQIGGRTQYLNDSTGRASTGRFLPTNWNVGIRALASTFALSDSDAGGSVTVNIAASTRTLDDGSVVSYPSASLTGLGYSSTIYVWRVDPDLNGGSSYGYSTAIANALGTGKVYLGFWTTRASAGTGGGGGGGGTENCVAADAFVMMSNGSSRLAQDVCAGDSIKITVNDGEWRVSDIRVESNLIAENECVTLESESGVKLTLAMNTPVVSQSGWDIAANAQGMALPVLDDKGYRFERITQVTYAGRRAVAKIIAHDAIYAAGDSPGRAIFTHNPVHKP